MLMLILALVLQASPITVRPIPPTVITSSRGGNAAVTITVTGREHARRQIRSKWSAEARCMKESECFLANWLYANTMSDIELLKQVRIPDERAELDVAVTRTPGLLTSNSQQFRQTSAWYLVGEIDYGPFIIAVLDRDGINGSGAYLLPLLRTDGVLGQTDTLARDTVYPILMRVGQAMIKRHP
jgi:hypothetical protein